MVSAKYRRVTDRQTDGQTSCDSIVRAMHTRRAVKMFKWPPQLLRQTTAVVTKVRPS